MNDERFTRLMGPALVRATDAEPSVVFGTWTDGTLAYVNPAWSRMALDNGGAPALATAPIGMNVWDAVPPVLQAHYRRMWEHAQQQGTPCEHDYECSSPERKRLFRMVVHPLGTQGFLIRNHPCADVPHPDQPHALQVDLYRNADGFITMCANCRRTRPIRTPAEWHWVPSLLSPPVDGVSHGLCAPCLELYYPAPADPPH